mgnify:CR=1 FL=1
MPQTGSVLAGWSRLGGAEGVQSAWQALDSILEGAKDLVRQTENALNQGVQAAEQGVQYGLQQEQDWLRFWGEALEGSTLAPLGQPALDLSRRLLEQRTQLWETWFSLNRQISLEPVERLLDQLKPNQELIAGWRDLLQSLFDVWGLPQAEQPAAGASEAAVEEAAASEQQPAPGGGKSRSGRGVAARAAATA